MPRRALGTWAAPEDRPDPVAVIEAGDAGRLPDLVPIRHGRMATSPFAFFRGAAAVMAWDLGTRPSTGLRVQLCGDSHLENFGLFSTPGQEEVFDVDDFDETAPGPFEWDVMRLAASVVLASRSNRHSAAQGRAAAAAAVRGYREEMATLARIGPIEMWHAHIDSVRIVEGWAARHGAAGARAAARVLLRPRARPAAGALPNVARAVDGTIQFAWNPPFTTEPTAPEREHVENLLDGYRRSLSPEVRSLVGRYRCVDVAQRVVGVGSVGLRSWVLLMLADSEPLFLQLKQARASVLEPYSGRVGFRNAGRRVVVGQRTMQQASDLLLGWAHDPGEGVDYYARQLLDKRGSPRVETLGPAALAIYAALCGGTLARAHARSGDAAQLSGYVGTGPAFDSAVTAFVESYADQAARDHAAFTAAIESGRIASVPDERVSRRRSR
jgi:uncharacterized protein (DUF2252 family)